jgi:protein-L-isoaspartate(D-aspartate) O-methyltransferase
MGHVDGDERTEERDRLARAVARNTGIASERLLAAFRSVPRHAFVPVDQAVHAYEDRALPIGEEQTISQPSMIALMFDALAPEPSDRALEVGAGSGYAAALLAALVERVDAVEILPNLAERARAILARLGVSNVRIHRGTGERGLRDAAPFDVILVSAGARNVPPALVEQLAPNGRIAIPVGDDSGQHLLVGKRQGTGDVAWEKRMACLFVPLVTSDRGAEPGPVRPTRPYAT